LLGFQKIDKVNLKARFRPEKCSSLFLIVKNNEAAPQAKANGDIRN
jgi:hypothetical protein